MKSEFIPNDMPEELRRKTVAVLKQQLADALDLAMQAKQAHWNIQGPNFLSLHELFDQVAATITELSDVLAERAAQLGAVVEGTIQAVARDSRLPVYPLDLRQETDHLRALATALALFAASIRQASKDVDNTGDADTADIMTQVSRGADLLLWKVASHISEPAEVPREAASLWPSVVEPC